MTDKNPEYFMQEAAKTVSQRGTDNGYDAGQERSAAAVADMFNSMYPGFDLNEDHIWAIMLSVKLVRNARKPREDNIVDLIGYAGLLGESQSAPKKVKPSLHEKRGPSMEAKRLGWWLEPAQPELNDPVHIPDYKNIHLYQDDKCFKYKAISYNKKYWTLTEYK